MSPDGSVRPDYFPRSLILATGEDLPRGQSLRARLVVMDVERGDIDPAILSRYQNRETRLSLRLAMAGYLQWLSERYLSVRDELPLKLSQFRDGIVAAGQHARTPDAIANICVGWWYWLRFSESVGALSREEASEAWDRAYSALLGVATDQAVHQSDEDPADRFLALIRSAISSGAAHVAAPNGDAPSEAGSWGWEFKTYGAGMSERSQWDAKGRCIGWKNGEDLYLDPASSYAEAQRLGTSGAGGLALTSRTLYKRLQQAGFLKTVDDKRGKLLVRQQIGGTRRYVIHFSASTLSDEKQAQQAHKAQEGPKSRDLWEKPTEEKWAYSETGGPEQAQADNNRPTNSADESPGDTPDSSGRGPCGPIGPVLMTGAASQLEPTNTYQRPLSFAALLELPKDEFERYRSELVFMPHTSADKDDLVAANRARNAAKAERNGATT